MGSDKSWRQDLEDILNAAEYIFPGAIRSVYLQGSRAEETALYDSDVDVCVVVRTSADMAQVGQMIGRRTLPNGVRLDAHVDTLQILADPAWASLAVRLKLSGDPIRGEDVRDLIAWPHFENYRARIFEEVSKGIGMLRDVDLDGLKRMPRPLGYPNPSQPFLGYEIVRKRDWYPTGTLTGTRELVAVATYCASAWVVSRERRYVVSKTQAMHALRQLENGSRSDLIEGIYRICRTKWQGRVPHESRDREELLGLCERYVGLENEILSLCEA